MKTVLNEQEINYFLKEIEKNFPNFVAGIITDRNGFPIASKIPQNFHIHENELALSAIASKRAFIKDSHFMKVKRDLDKSDNIKLLLLLKKNGKYIHYFKNLKNLIEKQGFF